MSVVTSLAKVGDVIAVVGASLGSHLEVCAESVQFRARPLLFGLSRVRGYGMWEWSGGRGRQTEVGHVVACVEIWRPLLLGLCCGLALR